MLNFEHQQQLHLTLALDVFILHEYIGYLSIKMLTRTESGRLSFVPNLFLIARANSFSEYDLSLSPKGLLSIAIFKKINFSQRYKILFQSKF